MLYIYDQKQLTEWLKIANDLITEYMKKEDTDTKTVDDNGVEMNDLIDRKSALNIFIEGDGDDDFTTGYNWAVDEYREKISKLPSVNNWIPCKDKLPEKDTDVLICACKHVVTAYFDAVKNVFRLTEDDNLYYLQEYVTHWMPRPNPPKNEEYDDEH